MFHVVSTSAALQAIFEYFLQALRSCAIDLVCSKSSILLKGGMGNSLSINFAVLISLFNVVMIIPLGLPLNRFLIQFSTYKCTIYNIMIKHCKSNTSISKGLIHKS